MLETVRLAGANPCPPMMLGVGIGSSFEGVALLAKVALVEMREGPHPDSFYAALENDLLTAINQTGIGPQGFGGLTTALSVRIKVAPYAYRGLACGSERRVSRYAPRQRNTVNPTSASFTRSIWVASGSAASRYGGTNPVAREP